MAPLPAESPTKGNNHCTIIVLGASGDLAFKKTYPALFGLFKNDLLPAIDIVGYARSDLQPDAFRKRIASKIKVSTDADRESLEKFLDLNTYIQGAYDTADSYKKLNEYCNNLEMGKTVKNRLFYMALPPSVFAVVSENLKGNAYSNDGWNRIIVEKPFGRDYETSGVLSKHLAKHWDESEIYRIDHYLGKEMVKNLMVLRFGNVFFGGIWNRFYISNVQITFKENIGTAGRGGYFDEFGIIRDVMQNHLLQILSIVGMEKPVSLDAEDVRNEKVKVLRAIPPVELSNVLLGQYTARPDGSEPGYLEDPTVPKGSTCPTFAAAVLHINNERWEGVPFILKCGKALNEQKTELRIQFRDVAGALYKNMARNELVIRVQPQEAVYMKFLNKKPGLGNDVVISELDLSYGKRYGDIAIPDAYESLIYDCLKGDKSNFVRGDELEAAWKIFTPLLHQIENEKIIPEHYTFGTRGPAKLNQFIQKQGYIRQENYVWNKV